MARRKRSKKSTPLNELGFVLVWAIGVPIATTQIDLNSGNIAAIFIAVLLFTLFVGSGLYLFFLHRQHAKQKALHAVEMADVDKMTGIEFEKYVEALLNSQGYKTKLTPINDYGVDIIASKNGVKTAVQVKRYNSKLDQKPVREAIAGKSVRKYGCTEAMVVTNNTFTSAAKFLANEGKCILIDREILGKWILEFKRLRI